MKKVLYILILTIFFGCTPILKPVMLENLNKESTTLDNLVEYLQKNNMKVINEFEPEIEERSTPIGTITLVTLETDWHDTGIFLEDLNSNGFVNRCSEMRLVGLEIQCDCDFFTLKHL